MPKVAELKEIDGAIWARVELLEPQPVHLLTDAEVQAIRKDEREGVIEVIRWYENVENFTAQQVIDRIRKTS